MRRLPADMDEVNAVTADKGKKQGDLPDAVAEAWKQARRVVVFVVGVTVVVVGLALLFLPGPAVVVIPAGLAILATEFVWARRLLRKARRAGGELGKYITGNKQGNSKGKGLSSAD